MRVPADLVVVSGRKEVSRSLATKDPAEARLRYVGVRAEFDAYWANLRQGPQIITEKEAHEFAVVFYDQWLMDHSDNPSQQTFWDPKIGGDLWSRRDVFASSLSGKPGTDLAPMWQAALRYAGHEKLEAWCLDQASTYLLERGLSDTPHNRETMARAIGAAVQRASLVLEQAGRGEIMTRGQPVTEGQPLSVRKVSSIFMNRDPAARPTGDTGNSLTSLIEGWWKEAQATGRKPSTYESYRNTFKTLIAFLGHDDAGRIEREDVLRFKDHRLHTPSARTGKVPSAKTVKDSDLSALKAVFEWAVMNGKLSENPAAKITVKLGKRPRLRSKGFTDDEAKAILSLALAHTRGHETLRTSAAKRWVPWLCAFTGGRVGELSQLRKEDVFQSDSHWIIRITPEAGTVKTNDAREVVLHTQLVTLGFPDFVKASPQGHLFLTPASSGDVLGPLQGLKNRLAEFARSVVPDPNVAPNHGWRHRFVTVGLEAGIPERVLNAIQGHAPHSVAGTYGDVSVKAMAQEIAKLPAYNLNET